jgi:hypothetical protein
MSLGQKNPREFREMEMDMLARKEQAKNMQQNHQDRFYEDSKGTKIVTAVVIIAVLAFVIYFIFFA